MFGTAVNIDFNTKVYISRYVGLCHWLHLLADKTFTDLTTFRNDLWV
jgi:hypothetical protein